MATIKKRRLQKATRRFNAQDLKEIVRDGRSWVHYGIVKAVEFYEETKDVLVEVELQPSLTPITARLLTPIGGPGWGIWALPPVGAEVIVALPEGDVAAGPVILGVTSNDQLHASTAATRILIVPPAGGQVHITDASGTVQPLVTKAEFDAHVHPLPTITCTGGAITASPIGTSGDVKTPAAITGTTVLKAK